MSEEKNDKTMKDIKTIITSLSSKIDDELFLKDKDGLEEYWHFQFSDKKKATDNMYEFYHMLKLYEHFCRRWEDHHNGSCCVVERVRDQYLMPKIKQFTGQLLVTYGNQ